MFQSFKIENGIVKGFHRNLDNSDLQRDLIAMLDFHDISVAKAKIQEYKVKEYYFLCNIEISSQYRGKGSGTTLLKEVKSLNKPIILVADEKETNSFDLVKWYEKNGFISIMPTQYGPLMIFIP